MTAVVLDTSAAVPYVVRSHVAHAATRAHLEGLDPVLAGHSLVETYSVLTRLPGDARLLPADAVRVIEANFGPPAMVTKSVSAKLPRLLATSGIAGGAVYDAMVAFTAKAAGLTLVTRDGRAVGTYRALGVPFEVVADTSDNLGS